MTTPVLISAASTEPVTLEEAKLWLRQDYQHDDALISSLIAGAREWFENALDHSLKLSTWAVKLPGFYSPIELPYPPLSSVTSVQYRDIDGATQTLATSVYNVVTSDTPGRIELASLQTWPTTDVYPEAVTITFTAFGTTSVPEMVKAGIKMLVAYWYGFRGDEGKLPEPPPAIDSVLWSARSYRF